MKRRHLALAAGLLCLVAMAPAAATAAPVEPVPLLPTSTMIRLGDTITVSGELCPEGLTVTAITLLDQADRAKGLSPWVPLDPAGVELTQTATGMSLRYTPTAAYHVISLAVECSDGTKGATPDPVKVFPPTGFYWAFNNYTPHFTADPGFTFFFGANTIECPSGSPAMGTLTAAGGTAPVLTMAATIGGEVYRGVTFDMDLPADMPTGVYTGTITCTPPGAAAVSDSQPVYVGVTPGSDTMPPSGGGDAVALAALGVVTLGLALVTFARRPRPRRSH